VGVSWPEVELPDWSREPAFVDPLVLADEELTEPLNSFVLELEAEPEPIAPPTCEPELELIDPPTSDDVLDDLWADDEDTCNWLLTLVTPAVFCTRVSMAVRSASLLTGPMMVTVPLLAEICRDGAIAANCELRAIVWRICVASDSSAPLILALPLTLAPPVLIVVELLLLLDPPGLAAITVSVAGKLGSVPTTVRPDTEDEGGYGVMTSL
jgi:hypothetical protein